MKTILLCLLALILLAGASFADDSLNVRCIAAYDHFGTYWVRPLCVTVNPTYPEIMYVGGRTGLQIIDISDPLDIEFLGETPSYDLRNCYDLIYYNSLFFQDGDYLYSIDVTNPDSIIVKDSIDAIGYRLEIRDHYLFVAGQAEGFSIVDISNPDSLSIVCKDTSRDIASISVDDTLMFATRVYSSNSGAVYRYDISDIHHPEIVDSIVLTYTPDWIYPDEIIVDGSYGYLLTGGSGNFLTMLDIEGTLDTLASHFICYQQLGVRCMKYGDYIFVTRDGGQFSTGIEIIDVSDPYYPEIHGYYRTWTNVETLRKGLLIDSLYYLPTYHHLRVLNVSDALSLSIPEIQTPAKLSLSAYPNPFNSAVRISVESPVGTGLRPARVEIFDIAGWRVAQLPSPSVPLPAGEGGNSFSLWEKVSEGRMRAEFTWQPDATLASGVYLVRARVGDRDITKRVVYLK